MTENEAKGWLIELKDCEETQEFYYADCIIEAFDTAIQALEEIQQYRAIGTVEDIQSMKDNGAFSGVELAQLAVMQMRLRDYQAIGTIEEFKALKEEVELYRNLDKTNFSDGYNKAIDEFAEKLSLEVSESIIWDMLATMSKNSSLSDTSDKIVDYVTETSKQIAEQMKAGVENE